MTDFAPDDRSAAVPAGRGARMLRMGGIAAGIAGGVIAGGLRRVAAGERPALSDLMLTPANALRLTEGLTHMRGAALKLGQMLSMDSGAVLPPELTAIMAAMRDGARHMPPQQLRAVLDRAWGPGWRSRFRSFDVRPFAAASIGQVHRAETVDGRRLAIKVQYPGVRACIDSDIANLGALMRLPGVLPRGMDIAPLLAAAREQLHEEADYLAEAAHLRRFGTLLADDPAFVLPQVDEGLTTPDVLAMTHVASLPVESLATAPQADRDRAAGLLIDLVLRELFDFNLMQTDPNLANFRVEVGTGRIVLLDFGAARAVDPALAAAFRALLSAALDRDGPRTAALMERIGYFGPQTAGRHRDLILTMFDAATEPLRQTAPFDFAAAGLPERLRDMGMAMGSERDLTHIPPAETLFLHRKIGGIYLLAARLGARVALRPLVERHRGTGPVPKTFAQSV